MGTRNSAIALAGTFIGGAAYFLKFQSLEEVIAWWVWPIVAVAAVAKCFAHAFLGTLVGGRRANNIFMVLLLGCLAALLIWLRNAAEGRR